MDRFQVPFIAFYRKEHIEPDLKINDLWKIWQWDEKVQLTRIISCQSLFLSCLVDDLQR